MIIHTSPRSVDERPQNERTKSVVPQVPHARVDPFDLP